MSSKTKVSRLADQLDVHWTSQLRPRLDGLTDDEYFWCPVSNCWTVAPDGSIDFVYPEPEPAPFTTIAWRLAHVVVGVLAMRNHSHFGGPPADYQSWHYATDAATALRQLDPPVPVPHDVPWFPQDVDFWNVRWVALHLIEELTRHAGHGDIIRESIDGATMYELMAGVEGWPETDWIKPWKATA